MLVVDHLSYSYPGDGQREQLRVIDDVSACFERSTVSVVLGPSGCGKTTLLNLITGILRTEYGTVKYPDEMRASNHRFGYVFQTPSLLPWRTIRANALFGAEITGSKNTETLSRCDQLLRTYGLSGFEDSYPIALSGGMQQRVSIVRAVLSGAKTILLDEPFSNSDFLMRRELQREISRLVSEDQLIAILVTHDVEEAVRIGDKVIVLTQRPARVSAEIKIPIPRDERVKGGASMIKVMAVHRRSGGRILSGDGNRHLNAGGEKVAWMSNFYAKLFLRATPAIAVFVAWQVLVFIAPRYDFVIGSPFGIWREFGLVIAEGNLPRDIGVTALEALLGFCAGATIGTAVGLALWGSKTVYEIARPYLIAFGSVPVFALGPALIFWFGTGIWSKVVLGFLVTFVIAVVQAHTGASEADPNLLG